MANDIEEQETSEETPEVDVELNETENAALDDATSKKVQEMDAQRIKWRDKAKKAEEERIILETKLGTLKDTLSPKEAEEAGEPSQFDTIVDISTTISSMNPDEVEDLRVQAKKMGLNPMDLANSEVFKTHLEATRVKKKAEKAVPEPSARSPKIEGKSLADMSKAERSKNFSFEAFKARRREQ